ncbi:hypothetical protein BGZ94_000145 [Podila epigama]|nr:hypothetical protein BGZ94_000145 [Podila epigama]
MITPSKHCAHFLTSFRRLVRLENSCLLHTKARLQRQSLELGTDSLHHRSLSVLQHDNVRNRRYTTAALAEPLSKEIPGGHSETDHGPRQKERVLLLMSGGVDSSMCAHILHSQGYHVTGLYMHNWNHQEETQDEVEGKPYQRRSVNTAHLHEIMSGTPDADVENRLPRTAQIRPKVCTSERDWADVQAVCKEIGTPCRRLDFSRQYWNQVFEIMLREYEQGRTPNPDVTCNKEIKFGELISWCEKNGGLGKDRHVSAQSASSAVLGSENEPRLSRRDDIGWDYLATGHYARVERDPVTGQARLLRARDNNKDQTYYLSTLSEKVLRHVLFPLAQLDKPTVKKMAMKTGEAQLRNAASKKESMGICFVGQRRRFGDFLKEYLDLRPGPVKVDSMEGPVIGEHKGLAQYTVGQASAVIHGSKKWVVLRSDLPSNTLIVVEGTQNKRLFSIGLIADKWHWISGSPPKKLFEGGSNDPFPFTAQIRHRQTPQPCTIEPVQDGDAPMTLATALRVRFQEPQRAIAPGQQLVLYDKDECLGGAVIQASLPSLDV